MTRPNYPFAYGLGMMMIGVGLSKNWRLSGSVSARLVRLSFWERLVLFLIPIALLQALFYLLPNNEFWNLDSEGDVGTFYSAVALFFAGLIVYDIFRLEKGMGATRREAWLPILFLFWGLSIDELVSAHNATVHFLRQLGLFGEISQHSERYEQWPWVIFLSPFAIAVIFYMKRFFTDRFHHCRRSFILSGIGLVVWINAYLFEIMVATSFPRKLQGGIEEGSELLGTTLFGLAFLEFFAYTARSYPKLEASEEDAVRKPLRF